jgi:iduronate 2-sulfatase
MIRSITFAYFLLIGLLAAAEKPNVLFIIADDMRPVLSCYGAPIQTPNIDKLAAQSVRFEKAYCQYPLCNPSRTSMLTSLRPDVSGVLDNSGDFRKTHPDLVTLPQLFKNHGYTTIGNGKIYHGGIDDALSWTDARPANGKGRPPGQPFVTNPTGDPTTERIGPTSDQMKHSDHRTILSGDGEHHADYRAADAAILAMSRLKNQPFFITCGFLKPHADPAAPQRFYDLYPPEKITLPDDFAAFPTPPKGFPAAALTKNNIDLFWNREANAAEAKLMIQAYRASVSWTDWNIGRVLKALDDHALREKTIVVLWGDHGYHLGEMGKWSKHSSLFDIGARVPLLISMPTAKGNGAACTRVVETLDIYPTLAALCGLQTPAHVQGRDLSPLLDDPKAPWDHPAITVTGKADQLHRTLRTERWRYIDWAGPQGGKALIDEQNDPHERSNLIHDPQHAETVKQLQMQLDSISAKKPNAAAPALKAEAPVRKTTVSIQGDDIHINGKPTYEGRTWNGHRIEGLLINNRLVNATFDDLNPETVTRWAYPDTKKWDTERNVSEFIAAMPEMKAHGVLGITLNFQGGSPEGYSKGQPWENHPFNADGTLRPAFTDRMKRVLDEADRLGMVPIVGYFYFGQSGRLKTDENCIRATDTLSKWLLDGGWRNVLVEINNESSPGYRPEILRPDRVHELIARVRDTKSADGRRLLVGTSFPVKVMPTAEVVRASDFILLHGNGFPDAEALLAKATASRALAPEHKIPLLINEDDHNDFAEPHGRLQACTAAHISWGWFDWRRKDEAFEEGYQSMPANWGLSSKRKREFHAKVAEITGSKPSTASINPDIREGDWLITTHEVIKGRTQKVNGNIIIRDGGRLTLEDATLEVLGKFSREHQIKLEDNGTLITQRATLGGTANKGGAPVHTVILLHGGSWVAEDTTIQYSYGVNCAYDKPSRLHAVRLHAGPRPDAVIVSGQADVTLIDSDFPLAISVYAKNGGKARLDLPVKTPITRTFDSSNLPGVKYKLKLERFTVPDHWFVFVFDINQDHPPLDLEFGDCPKFLASLLGHNIQSQLTLSSDLAEPLKYGNLTMSRAEGSKPNISMWNIYAGGEKTDVTIQGTGFIAELMHSGGQMKLIGEGDHALQLGCTTLDLNNAAHLDLENVHLGRPLNWKPEKAKGEASINGSAQLTGRNLSINNVTFHTRQSGSVTLDEVTGANSAEQREEGGKITLKGKP